MRKKQKKRMVFGLILGIILLCNCLVQASTPYISIAEAYTIPQQPETDESISVFAQGGVVEMVPIDHTDLTITSTSVEVDIFFDFSIPHNMVPTSWSHSEDIGTLTAGTYELTVRTFELLDIPEPPVDTYITEFTVVPEPTMIILLAGGALLMGGRYRNKSRQM